MRFIGESVSGGDRRHRSDHTTMVNQAAGRWGGGGVNEIRLLLSRLHAATGVPLSDESSLKALPRHCPATILGLLFLSGTVNFCLSPQSAAELKYLL